MHQHDCGVVMVTCDNVISLFELCFHVVLLVPGRILYWRTTVRGMLADLAQHGTLATTGPNGSTQTSTLTQWHWYHSALRQDCATEESRWLSHIFNLKLSFHLLKYLLYLSVCRSGSNEVVNMHEQKPCRTTVFLDAHTDRYRVRKI